ncbi:hypothetical protein ACFFRR_011238 [Megaselia abdita]
MTSFPIKSPLNNKNIIATIASDGQVYSLDNNSANFVKMLTFPGEESESMLRTTPAAILDMGKNLIQYSKDDNVEGVAEMMNKGAPFTSDWLGMTPIHFAVVNNSVAVTNVLLNAGVNLDVKTKVDRTPLHLAAYYGHDEIAEMLLQSGKCMVNSKDFFKMTPLHWAVEKRNKGIVRLLLEYDADPTVVSKFGKTPIAIAVQTEQPDILEILENAKNSQQSKKFNEESMANASLLDAKDKEASDAVNSILGITDLPPPVELEDEDNKVRAIICNHDDDDDHSADVDSMINLTNMNGNGNQTTLDILKTHGISMMSEDDEDPSSNLLTSALQSGRKLVLSEGGKLVLNDTKMAVNGDSRPKVLTNSKPAMHFINPIEKKNSVTVGNKNVRIISIEELQKMNSEKFKPNLKRVTKVPQTIQTTPRKVFMNPKVTQQMNPITRRIEESSEDETSIKIPKITSGTFTTNLNELERRKPTPLKVIKHTPTGTPSIGAIKLNHPQRFTPNQTNNIQPQQKSKGPVLPLLNSADTSREIFLLKKQVKEMKSKMDDVQRENEQLRRRIDKLEGLKLDNESLNARLEHIEKLLCNQIAIENPNDDDVIEEEFDETLVENML